MQLSPIARKRWNAFKSSKRGFYSGILVLVIMFFCYTAEIWVNKRALVVKYEDNWYFPVFSDIRSGTFFGDDYPWEVNYRKLQDRFAQEKTGNFVLMPVVPFDPYEQHQYPGSYAPFPISATHWLGTDASGRDLLARVVYGMRVSLTYAIITTLGLFIIGLFAGISLGYFGGKFDLIGQRLVEIWSGIPNFQVLLLIAFLVEPSVYMLAVISIFLSWPGLTTTFRALAYRERARDYVMASKALGASTTRIITKHITPNLVANIVTALPFLITGQIFALASLDFLGFGVAPPTPTFGGLMAEGRSHWENAPNILWSGIIGLTIIMVLITFVGESVREAFDPKKYTRYQ